MPRGRTAMESWFITALTLNTPYEIKAVLYDMQREQEIIVTYNPASRDGRILAGFCTAGDH